MSPDDRRALQILIEAVVNGEATDEQHSQLEAQLLSDELAQDIYLDYVNLHAALRQRLLTADASSSFDLVDLHVEIASESFRYPQRRRWPAYLAVVASLLLFVATGALMQSWRGWGSQPLATLRSIEGEMTIVSSTGSRVGAVGDLLRAGETARLVGEASRASFDYPDGTQIRLHSESVMRIPATGNVRLELLDGSLEVDAAKQRADNPLIIATQHSRYVVLGTRFRLYHDPQASRLELDEGKVRMERPAYGEVLDVDAGSVAIATSDDAPVEIRPLSLGTAALVKTLSKAGNKVEFSPDRLLTSHASHGLQTYRRDDLTLDQVFLQHAGGADAVAFAADGHLVQVNRNGYVLAWKPGQQQGLKLPLPGESPRSRALSPDGQFVAISAERTTSVLHVDFETQKLEPLLDLHPSGKAWCLSLSSEGRRLAAGYWHGSVHVYDVPGGELVYEHKLTHTPTHCDLSHDGRFLVIVTQKDGLLLIDLATGEQKPLWPAGANIVRCLCFSQDGRRVLAGFNDRTARMWNSADGKQELVVDTGHSPQGIAWSEEDQILITADGSVKVWQCSWPASRANSETK